MGHPADGSQQFDAQTRNSKERSRLDVKLVGCSRAEERAQGERVEHQGERVWEGALQ